jgi:hypothetical protein
MALHKRGWAHRHPTPRAWFARGSLIPQTNFRMAPDRGLTGAYAQLTPGADASTDTATPDTSIGAKDAAGCRELANDQNLPLGV